MEHSENISAFAAAFVAAQADVKGAEKDKTNPHYRSSYADLGSVMDACKDALSKNGIAVIQSPVPSDTGTLALDTVLMHKSGEWVSGKIVMPLSKNDPQGYGSAMTYARRYGLAAMVGVCPEDDDAESAVSHSNGQRRPQPSPAATKKAAPPAVIPGAQMPVEQVLAYQERIDQALKDRGFDVPDAEAVIEKVLRKLKVPNLKSAGKDLCEKFISNIAAGMYDNLKPVAAESAK